MVFLEILVNYILPVIYDSFVSLVLVSFFLFIFRIKDSNIRILFFFLPLIKPFIIISEKIDKTYFQSYPVAGLFRLPDPNNIFRIFEGFDKGPLIFSNINYIILLLVIISITLILIIRWINLYLFYRNLSHEDIVDRKDIPGIYAIIDDYIQKNEDKSSLCKSNTQVTEKTFLKFMP